MTGQVALVVHGEPEIQRQVAEALRGAGFKVMLERPGAELRDRLASLPFLPDILLTELASGSDDDSTVLSQLRANPLAEQIPVVLLASGDAEERRLALRQGVTRFVLPPYDGEEVVLLTQMALSQARDNRLLSGSLSQLPITDLLQTFDVHRKSGRVTVRSRGREGTLWLRGGRIIDAVTEDGKTGEAAVYAVAQWDEGTFEAELGPVEVPERISQGTTFLLLEAMRRKDEMARYGESPPHAALIDPPPAPPRSLLAVHRALTLLNVAASYSSAHLLSPLLEQRLEELRSELSGDHPILEHFAVGAHGRVTVDLEFRGDEDPEPLVAAVGAWLRGFFARMDRALPGRFDIARLAALTEVVQEDLRDLGFYGALGLNRDGEEET